MSIFSLIILVWVSVFSETLVSSNLRIYFWTSSMFPSLKSNVFFLLNFRIARMLGWFLYFKIALKTGSLMFLVTELFQLYFEIKSFLIILEQKSNASAVSDSDVSVFSFSLRFIFSLDNDLSESKDFTVFQNVLLCMTFFSSKFW